MCICVSVWHVWTRWAESRWLLFTLLQECLKSGSLTPNAGRTKSHFKMGLFHLIQPDWLCCSVGLFSSHSFLKNGPFTQWDDWLRDSTCSNCWSPRKLLNVRRFVYCNNAAGIRKFWERDRSLQEPVPLPAQQSRVRGWWDFGELCST